MFCKEFNSEHTTFLDDDVIIVTSWRYVRQQLSITAQSSMVI